MKILELLEHILDEAATANLYHGTSLNGALEILQSDLIKANMPVHSNQIPKTVKGQSRTVSLTRDLYTANKFARDAASRRGITGVIFVIDQDKLKRDLGRKVRPYDDTSTDWYRQQARVDHKKSLRPTFRAEFEEVVYGNIPNANRYIKNIIILPPGDDNNQQTIDQIKNTGILDDPRTVFDIEPRDYAEYRKERSDKYYLGKLGIK